MKGRLGRGDHNQRGFYFGEDDGAFILAFRVIFSYSDNKNLRLYKVQTFLRDGNDVL